MDKVLRRYMDANKDKSCPNAEPNVYYGSVGDPIPPDFSCLRSSPTDPIRRFILDTILVPFHHKIYRPLATMYTRLLGRDPSTGESQVRGRTITIVVATLETLIATAVFAGSVAFLYSLKSTKMRLITAFFMSIICAIPAALLSEAMKSVSVLIAG